MSGSGIRGGAVRHLQTKMRVRETEKRGGGGGPRRSGRALSENVRLTDQGWSSSLAVGNSNSDADADVVESEEEEEEEDEEEIEDSASGVVETIRVENVTVRHEVYTSAASCFCSACRVRDYDKCTIFSTYPALVPRRQLNVIEEKVIMDTGVDPAGADARAGGRKKKTKEIKFPSRSSFCSMQRITGTQFGESFCGGT